MASFYARYSGTFGGGGGGGGVTSLNGETGDIDLVAGSNITITPAGQNITISAASPTSGNLTDVGTDGIVITGGTGAVLGAGTSIAQHVADVSHNGYLSSTDWATFNGKQPAGNYITALTGDVSASGAGSVAATVNSVGGSTASAVNTATIAANAATATPTASTIAKWDASTNMAANHFQALSGDATTPGFWSDTGGGKAGMYFSPVSGNVLSYNGVDVANYINSQWQFQKPVNLVFTSNVSTPSLYWNNNSHTGFYQIANNNIGFTVSSSKVLDISSGGLDITGNVTATNLSGTNTGDVTIGTANGLSLAAQALSLGLSSTSTTGALSSTDWNTFNGKQASGNYITALTGDVTASGPNSAAATLATVNANVGSFGSSTAIPNFTVNGKGLITAAGTNAVIAPAGTLTGTTLASNVVTSSLTTVGTIATGTWSATTVAANKGGTGQTTYTDGQLLIGNTSGNTLTKSTLTAGSGVTITNGNGSITIAASGGSSNTNKIFYTNTTITSGITSATDTRCQYNTSVYDPNSLVTTGGSWVFTAAATAWHQMTAGVIVNGTFTGGQTYRIGLFVNGSEVMRNLYRPQSSETNALGLQVSGGYQLTVGDTVYAAVNVTGSGFTFVNIASVMYISISQE